MNKSNLIIPAVFLIIGFSSAYVIFGLETDRSNLAAPVNNKEQTADRLLGINPFTEEEKNNNAIVSNLKEQNRLDFLEEEVSQIKQQLNYIEATLLSISNTTAGVPPNAVSINRNRFPALSFQRFYNQQSLIRGGLSATVAEDIIRRKNSIELKRLALLDRAKRENYLDTQRYFDELNTINLQDVNLREELGDARYDKYLYTSKQNNRVLVASVMLGSAAEQSGLQKGDIILSYDNKQVFSWRELKSATTEGQLGEFVSINIVREGDIYSFSVPRGPLGIQLGATRLSP